MNKKFDFHMVKKDSSKYKTGIYNFLLLNLFVFQVMAGTISNYTVSALVIKIGASLLILPLIIYEIRTRYFDLGKFLITDEFKKPILYSLLLLLLPAFTLLYSENPEFGIQKTIHFIAGPLPSILYTLFLIKLWDKEKTQSLKFLIGTYGILIPIIVISINPFIYNTAYEFTFTRWSHVVLGRFLGAVLIISIYYLLKSDRKIERVLFFISTSLLLYSVYYTGLRAALLGVGIIIPVMIIYEVVKMRKLKSGVTAAIISIVLVTGYTLSTGFSKSKIERYENLTEFKDLEFGGDGAVISRLQAYEISWERFLEKPIFGLGYGGFKSFYKTELPVWIRYPHNIILEFMVELGLVGLVLLVMLLWRMFASAWKYDKGLFFYLLFALWLAMFSKDIASQSMLWVGIGLVKR